MLEKDLVSECYQAAKAMGAFLTHVGQGGKRNHNSLGYPDLTLICAGHIVLIEVKRPPTPDNPRGFLSIGQLAFIERAAEQGVTVHVVDSLSDFVDVVNSCRRQTWRMAR